MCLLQSNTHHNSYIIYVQSGWPAETSSESQVNMVVIDAADLRELRGVPAAVARSNILARGI